MDKREKLAERAHVKYYGYEIPDDLERYVWLGVVDAILDELMEPGEGALRAASKYSPMNRELFKIELERMLTHIKDGKP